MSKMDALRAMREAGHEQAMARAAQRGTTPAVEPVRVSPATTAASRPVSVESCGHRSINGRTCTREQGHAAKSHRYS